VTPIEIIQEHTGMSLIKNHIKGPASALYLQLASSQNHHIPELGKYDPVNDKYQPTRFLLSR
jgi:hypothetical protein